MKYNEKFFCYIKNTQEHGNDFLCEVIGATYDENPRLFIHKVSDFFCLCDKETGQGLGSAKTLKELNKKYNERWSDLYTKLITNHFELYKQKIKLFKQLKKENLIGVLKNVSK